MTKIKVKLNANTPNEMVSSLNKIFDHQEQRITKLHEAIDQVQKNLEILDFEADKMFKGILQELERNDIELGTFCNRVSGIEESLKINERKNPGPKCHKKKTAK